MGSLYQHSESLHVRDSSRACTHILVLTGQSLILTVIPGWWQIRIYVILHNRINVYRAFLTYIYSQGIRAIAETGDHILSISITPLS